MSKKRKSTKRRAKKLHLAGNENLLVKLEEVAKKGTSDSSTAWSLLRWYMEHKEWSTKQLLYVKAICSKKDKPRSKPPSKVYLYAVSDDDSVKLGFSCNINSRIKSMQTGHPKKLKCIWKYYVGTSRIEAKKLEGKLHRYCKKYRIRGEWFKPECMALVNRFSARENYSREREVESADLEILAEALKRI